ncbi:maleylacetoacetate isomerase [Vibrio nigripulchritudo]|uniref:maleylacetoacetate isomerase n=1 Tax=Vibrio nigripulchritudo TaxID=28173 RepID=UPI0005FA563B|nr:maleylacetoacetate isomerase [Vibrio nigripulchritudo]KJY73756.1 maleylacetoacetate isomerase [Vibrio nigripulchritudo]BDU39515.1 maleylacetoacetate isomerase [Vibrio nigripulchritudo]BDU45236.1 maleylacetoacetate isomerase [Vibrio nigripulchritudo]
MKLYDYIRSSAAYRVRIALNLKGVDCESIPVSLLDGDQKSSEYLDVNSAGLVPALETQGNIITQSLAIIEYLDELYPELPLLPEHPVERAQCRALAYDVTCDIHPLNNLRILKHLTSELGHSEEEKMAWYHHWLKEGFNGLEQKLSKSDSTFCCGESPTLADICLIPQLFNAHRFEFNLAAYPRLKEIESNCLALSAFSDASPK